MREKVAIDHTSLVASASTLPIAPPTKVALGGSTMPGVTPHGSLHEVTALAAPYLKVSTEMPLASTAVLATVPVRSSSLGEAATKK